jgi:hypothetical protein
VATLQLRDINAFTVVPDHIEVAIRRLPRACNLNHSTYRRLWRLLHNGATMDQCYSMIPSKRPALNLMRERLGKEIGIESK